MSRKLPVVSAEAQQVWVSGTGYPPRGQCRAAGSCSRGSLRNLGPGVVSAVTIGLWVHLGKHVHFLKSSSNNQPWDSGDSLQPRGAAGPCFGALLSTSADNENGKRWQQRPPRVPFPLPSRLWAGRQGSHRTVVRSGWGGWVRLPGLRFDVTDW